MAQPSIPNAAFHLCLMIVSLLAMQAPFQDWCPVLSAAARHTGIEEFTPDLPDEEKPGSLWYQWAIGWFLTQVAKFTHSLTAPIHRDHRRFFICVVRVHVFVDIAAQGHRIPVPYEPPFYSRRQRNLFLAFEIRY